MKNGDDVLPTPRDPHRLSYEDKLAIAVSHHCTAMVDDKIAVLQSFPDSITKIWFVPPSEEQKLKGTAKHQMRRQPLAALRGPIRVAFADQHDPQHRVGQRAQGCNRLESQRHRLLRREIAKDAADIAANHAARRSAGRKGGGGGGGGSGGVFSTCFRRPRHCRRRATLDNARRICTRASEVSLSEAPKTPVSASLRLRQ